MNNRNINHKIQFNVYITELIVNAAKMNRLLTEYTATV